MSYDIWLEGYAITGGNGIAKNFGTFKADSFEEACELALIKHKYDMSYYTKETNTFWGCRFFDNGSDARRSFG